MQIQTRNLEDLSLHPIVKNHPRLSDDEMLGWRRSLKWRGEDNVPAIAITADNQIVDGRHRYWCARKLGWKSIPVVVVPESEIGKIVVGSLASRRAYSKAQIAFTLAEFVDPKLNEARMLAGIEQKGTLRTDAQGGRFSTGELAEIIGVSSRIIQQAMELRELFKADKTRRTMTDRDGVTEKNVTLEDFFMPRIMRSEDPEAPRTRAYGLGAVLAGAKAVVKMEARSDVRPHGGGRPEKVEGQLQLFDGALVDFSKKFIYWEKWDDEVRTEAVKILPKVVEKMPSDLLNAFAKTITTELKRREK